MSRQLLPLFVLVLWCFFLLSVRFIWSGGFGASLLFWNLLLAMIPLVAALFLTVSIQGVHGSLLRVLAFVVWILFLPNAPYIITDLMHLAIQTPIPKWFDALLGATFAITGVVLGYASVTVVQRAFAKRHSAIVGWCVAVGGLYLSGIGIYLGRVLRWNSWDVVLQPAAIANHVITIATNSNALSHFFAMTSFYGTTLIVGYIVIRLVAPVFELSDAEIIGT